MKCSVIIGVCLSLLHVGLTGQDLVAEEETGDLTNTKKIVVVKTFEEPDTITLFVTVGTTINWINHSKYPVQVVFLVKQVVLACCSPVNFVVGKDGTYESIKMSSGGTASLCFTEKGRYSYKTIPSKKFIVGKKGKEHFGTVWIK